MIIATDNTQIEVVTQQFGADTCLTSVANQSGTDRVAEVAENLTFVDELIVVNLQGDEPLMPSVVIYQVAENLVVCTSVSMATICTWITITAELFDPHVVKVVKDRQGSILFQLYQYSLGPGGLCQYGRNFA